MNASHWKPQAKDYLDALTIQNPWGKLGRVPVSLAPPVRRPLTDQLWRALQKAPPAARPTRSSPPSRYQVILGPRRVGKTVAMYQAIDQLLASGVEPNRLWFLRLDHPLLMQHDLGAWVRQLIDTVGALPARPLYLFLDEINYSPNWDKWLKTFFDEQWPVRIVATSSSAAALRDRTVESGIGRWSEQFLTPYSFSEFLALLDESPSLPAAEPDLLQTLHAFIDAKPDCARLIDPLTMFLLVGGFPELLIKEVAPILDAAPDGRTSPQALEDALFRSQQVLRAEAVQRVTGMDIPQTADIRNPLLLERLLYMLAGRMCGGINTSQLSVDLSLSRPTIGQYINHLERAFLIFTLPNYSRSEDSVQSKGRKVFFLDGAVRNAALQRGLAPLTDPTEFGSLLENAAAAHLHALSLQSGARLYTWRDRQREVDLIYELSGQPLAFEITSSSRHSLDGLRAARDRFPALNGRCFLISNASTVYSSPAADPDGIGRIPLTAFLLAVGTQLMSSLKQRFV
jgi:uncharacterized protein